MMQRSLIASAALAALYALPGAGELAGQETHRCDDDRAGIRVTVLDATGTVPARADVRVRWADAVRSPARHGVGDDGHLSFCAPGDAMKATVWAEAGDAASEQAYVELTPGRTSAVELRILGEANPGRLEGRVFDAVTGDPIAIAAVTVAGRPTPVETDRWGRYILTGVPAGAAEFEVRRMGYEPLRHTLNVKSGLTTQVDIGLVADPVEMEPIVATTIRSSRLVSEGFYERQFWGEMLGVGEFLTPEYLERWRPMRMSQLIEQFTILRPRLVRAGRTPGTFGDCLQVYLDSMHVEGPLLNSIVLPSEVAGVEVYRATTALPTDLMRFQSRCNLVLIWTGR
ncbi:carboxypeptidase regulatory-like domain-containing protein [Candidatus Palauibacter sp.]|uniref:carboxypeptidase regulatory-like domain-containing protein n=1 Tax=Candidatus Palauibacter sp. TaxID=3101350 RepID=UPI003B51D768